MTVDELWALLQAAPRHDALTLGGNDIPSAPGVYVWYAKETGAPVYVGKATGRKGLRHRLWDQHLNPGYLEGRATKITADDAFQLSWAHLKGRRLCIDKSVFRRNVGRRLRLAPGRATVDYLREHFAVAWVTLPRSEISALERGLIATVATTWDLYNLSHKSLTR
jgi:hypothetical protein